MTARMVEFPSNGGTTAGYLSIPDAGSGPGVIVIQEWWGLNDQIKGTADRFASEGFVALAPDFFHGDDASFKEPDKAGKLMMALNVDEVAKEAKGVAEYLAGLDRVTSQRVGVIGYCMGGKLALLTATVAPQHIGAVVDMYGIHPKITPDFSKLDAPVLALFAGNDDSIDEDARAALAKQLSDAGVKFEIDLYPGVDHAFMNEMREVYDKDAAEDAWRRILDLFRANLN